MNGGFHPRDCVTRLYIPRAEGGRGLRSVEDCVEQARKSLEMYVQNSKEKLVGSVRKKVLENVETSEAFKARRKAENVGGGEGKPLHGQFARQNKDQRSEIMWMGLKIGQLKRETEALIVAAQDQAIRTNYIKAKIDTTEDNPKGRMCNQRDETVSNIVTAFPKMAQKECKKGHDNVAKAVHWDPTGKCGFQRAGKWYEYVPYGVLDNEGYKIPWDFNIQQIMASKQEDSDIIVVNKQGKNCQITDVAKVIPIVMGADEEDEQTEHYQNLTRELRKVWNIRQK